MLMAQRKTRFRRTRTSELASQLARLPLKARADLLPNKAFDFTTYGQLRVVDTQCGFEQSCTPFDSFRISLSNQLDTETFDAAKVRIEPEIPGVKIQGSYKQITIEGSKQSKTNYTVTLDRTIRDTFNQKLTGDNTFSFKVKTSLPALFSSSSGLVVLDPAGPRAFNVYSINYTRLRVMLFKVTPHDWPQFNRYLAAPSHPAKPADFTSRSALHRQGDRHKGRA